MSEQTDLVARLPWVTRLQATQDCDGYRWSHMPGKALRDPELKQKYKCKARARWQFRALPETDLYSLVARSGTYCWSHLFTQLRAFPPEEDRYRREMARLRAAA